MLIGVIYWAVNCPICGGWDYYGLQWFNTRKELIHWLAEHGKSAFFVKEVWDANTKEKLVFDIKYIPSFHTYVGVEVWENGNKLAILKQDPYDDSKKWAIEDLDSEIEFCE